MNKENTEKLNLDQKKWHWLIPGITAIISILFGLSGIIGWLFDISILRSLTPDEIPLPANGALCFFITGVTILLQTPKFINKG